MNVVASFAETGLARSGWSQDTVANTCKVAAYA
jgi:hypothetical protein